jgi:hypothetical protein
MLPNDSHGGDEMFLIPFIILGGLPLLIHIELLGRSLSQRFKNRGVRAGVGVFVY